MANNLFARSILEKYGWKTGAGLGKEEHGIQEPIKVSLKNSKSGLGHIPGSDLTRNWWDQMYNDAAKKISVNTDNNEKPKQEKIREESSPKNLLYGNFLQGSTQYSNHTGIVEEAVSESQPEVSQNCPPRLTDEQLFEICGRRTAHKAARHGLRLNGKLQRIKEQEQRFLESLESAKNHKNQISNTKISSISGNHTKVEAEKQQNNLDDDGYIEEETLIKKRKKKKKKNKNDLVEVGLEETVDCRQDSENQVFQENKLLVSENLTDSDKEIVWLPKQDDVSTKDGFKLKYKVKKHKKRKHNL
ncbi:G patch domain-containing protein 4-like isoform X1 [Octopus sinensis]|uniref:G patch domain-containing protein 4 n=2 Tax=Octopus sinensis TaxID=2607531 RepID=A0A7E6FD16_9MOLL|nr:G patch domain-containing protein 4-like isoform X1 [Octopus sinensis]